MVYGPWVGQKTKFETLEAVNQMSKVSDTTAILISGFKRSFSDLSSILSSFAISLQFQFHLHYP